jgi:hypothetical protein
MEFFLIATASRPALGPTQLPIEWVSGVKRPGCEDDHSPRFTAEVKNPCYTFTTPIRFFVAWCFVKHMENFIQNKRFGTNFHVEDYQFITTLRKEKCLYLNRTLISPKSMRLL